MVALMQGDRLVPFERFAMSAPTSKRQGFNTDNLPKARALIILAMVGFSIQDLVVKLILIDMSVWQMQLLRSVACMVLLVLTAWGLKKTDSLLPSQWIWPFIRAIFMAGAYVFFYISLPFLSLSQASATFFIGPMLISILAVLFLGETIGWRRIMALVVGFAGVLLIVQPGDKEFSPIVLLPAAAAACYACGVIITRSRCRKDPAFSLSMMHNFFYALVGGEIVILLELIPVDPSLVVKWPALLGGWSTMSLSASAFIVLIAVTHTIASTTSVRAYQLADAGQIAPLEYTYLAIAPLWDYLVFNNLPSILTFAGMSFIAAGGILISWREGRPARPKPQNYGEEPWVSDRKFDKKLFGTRIEIGLKLTRDKAVEKP